MKALNLEKALILYKTISSYLPELKDPEDIDTLDYVGEIVDNIIKEEKYVDFTTAIFLMTGTSLSELSQLSSNEVVELFIDGLAENRILELDIFCREIGIYG